MSYVCGCPIGCGTRDWDGHSRFYLQHGDWRVVIGSVVNPYLAPSSASFAKRVKRSVLRVLGILLYVSPLGPVVAI